MKLKLCFYIYYLEDKRINAQRYPVQKRNKGSYYLVSYL